MDLGRRGLRAQEAPLVEEERGAVRSRGMPLGEGELVEVVLGRLDLAVVSDLVAEPDERVLDLAAGLRDRMEVAEGKLLAGERDVDDVLRQGALELGTFELLLACG